MNKDKVVYSLIYFCASLSVIILLTLITYVFIKGIGVINFDFLTTVSSAYKGTVGIAGNIINTLYIIFITLLIGLPVGIGSAIYLNEYAKNKKFVSIIEYCTETLSGLPSIIFGLFGMMFFGQTLHLGYSILTGCLTLILMILPLIVRNTQEALKTVPKLYRDGALSLGAGKWYMIRTVVLPSCIKGIITGLILGVGRIVSESAALLFTAGSGKLLIKSLSVESLFKKLFESGGTMAVQLYLSCTVEGDFETAFGIALILIVIVLSINMSAKALANKIEKKKG